MSSKLVEPHAGTDVVDDANFMMPVLLILMAMMFACISCVVCAFLRNRRRQDREVSILRQFYNAEYDHVDTLDCTRLPSQSCANTLEISSSTGTHCLTPGQSKVPDVHKHSVSKIDAPERFDRHVTNEFTSRSSEERFYLKYPQKNLKSDMKLHEVDLDMPNRPPMLVPSSYTSAKQTSLYSSALDAKVDLYPPKCFCENGKSHMSAQYVNHTSVQTDERKIETQSTDLYSKLHDQNRRPDDNYSDVRLFGEQSDLMLSLDKTVPFPNRTHFHVYNNGEEFSHFDVCIPYDGLSQDLRTTGSSDLTQIISRDVNSIDKKVAAENISIEDVDDASSTTDDMYVNSDPWFTRACKTVTTERTRFGDSDDTSSGDEAVFEREEFKTSSISNEMYTNSDSWKNSVYVNQQINAVPSGTLYVSYDKDAALFGSKINMAESQNDDADKSSVEDDIYLNWKSRDENTQMNNMTMKGYYKQHSIDIIPHQFIKHDMGSANMSDTSSSSEEVNFYSDMSKLAVMRGESNQLAQGLDSRHTNTDVRCSEIEGDDNSFESDNIYINSDILSVAENKNEKCVIGATSSLSIVSDCDNDAVDVSTVHTAWSNQLSSIGAEKGTDHLKYYIGSPPSCSEGVDNEDNRSNQSDCDLTSDTQVEVTDDDSYYFKIY